MVSLTPSAADQVRSMLQAQPENAGKPLRVYVEGGGCANTGLIADVNYHEWGHGLHYYSLLSGTFDGSYSEGYSDTVAFLMTLDSTIAPGFLSAAQAASSA